MTSNSLSVVTVQIFGKDTTTCIVVTESTQLMLMQMTSLVIGCWIFIILGFGLYKCFKYKCRNTFRRRESSSSNNGDTLHLGEHKLPTYAELMERDQEISQFPSTSVKNE